MKAKKIWILFLLVLAADFAQSTFYFIRYFESREDNLSVVLFSLLHLLPLVALIVLSRKVQKIEDRKTLSLIRKFLASYLALDVILGLLTFSFFLPRFIGFLFYSKNWWFCIVHMIRYGQYDLSLDLAIDIFYWISYGIFLADISKRMNPSESEIDMNENIREISASFKIAVANMICLAALTVLNFFIYLAFEENKNGTGEHAIGMAVLVLILMAVKFIFSLPNLILSIVGIVKSRAPTEKGRKHSRCGLWINIACLVICEAEVFLWW